MRFFLKLILIFLPFLFIGLLFLIKPALAQVDSPSSNTVVIPRSQVIDRNYFASGGSVVLSGTVNGDAYIAGGNVVVDGTVNGDLLVAGGTVDIKGTVSNDIRVAGGQVLVSGPVGGNITVLAGSASLTDSARINGSFVGAGGNFSLFSPVGRSVDMSAGQVLIGSTIGNNVNIISPQIVLTPNARIAGDFTYVSNSQARIEQGAQVSGTTTQNFPEKKEAPAKPFAVIAAVDIIAKIISFIAAFIVGLLLLKVVPVITINTVDTINNKFWQSFGIGFLTVILLPTILFILMFTIVGIPIALILLATLLIFIYLANIFVAIWIGKKILGYEKQNVNLIWPLVLGLIVYIVLSLIPVIGWLTVVLIALLGLGAIIIEGKEKHFTLRSKKLI